MSTYPEMSVVIIRISSRILTVFPLVLSCEHTHAHCSLVLSRTINRRRPGIAYQQTLLFYWSSHTSSLYLFAICTLLLIIPKAWYLWYLVARLRARAESTKASKAGHIVPDKLHARQPTHLCDVIRDPWPFVGRYKACSRSDLNLMMGRLLWQNEVPAMRQNTRARIHCGFFHTTFSVVSNVDLQQHIFKLLLISLSKPRIWSQRHKAYILLRKSYILLL